MVTYRYAVSESLDLVDCQELDEATRRVGAPYSCLGCGRELIARLPKAGISKHFAHKVVGECSAETYLHKLAKRWFVDRYKTALESNQPFMLVREIAYQCRHYEEALGFTCGKKEKQDIDLTAYFDQCATEVAVGNFVADVLLSSSKTDQKLLIEFAVSHRCTEEKLESGFRIIEIDVESEDQAQEVGEGINLESYRVRAYNLDQKPINPNYCSGACPMVALVMTVHNSGKAILNSIPVSRYKPSDLSGTRIFEAVVGCAGKDPSKGLLAHYFRHGVREAHFHGVPIKNCFMCRYHGLGKEGGIYCKFKRINVNSNFAAECDAYRTMTTVKECEATDRQNDQFMITSAIREAMNFMFTPSHLRV